jgi:hypothetical protein
LIRWALLHKGIFRLLEYLNLELTVKRNKNSNCA